MSYSPSEEEWNDIFSLAKKHALLGISFVGVQLLKDTDQRPPQSVLFKWISSEQQIERKNRVLNKQSVILQKRLNIDGLSACILKGQGNALMYRQIDPLLGKMRQPGDIDVWVGGGFEKVLEYVQTIRPTDEVNEQHVHLKVFKHTEVEVHFTPSRLPNRWKNRILQQWFASEEERQMSHSVEFEDEEIVIPTADFNLVYQLLHIYRHLFSEGIGLRQLMDYYVLMMTNDLSTEEISVVKYQIHRFGLDTFASAIMWILGYAFKLDETKMLWTPDKKRGHFLLNEIMEMGNFGSGDSRFNLSYNDSHLKRYILMIKSKLRFAHYFPSEALWQPVEIFLRFFELRRLKKIALNYKNHKLQ